MLVGCWSGVLYRYIIIRAAPVDLHQKKGKRVISKGFGYTAKKEKRKGRRKKGKEKGKEEKDSASEAGVSIW